MSRSVRYRVADKFVLRTPLLPYEAIGGLRDRADLARLLDRPEVSEALFLASPSLHAQIPVWREDPESERGRRLQAALIKYLARMASRSTPFGLFAGVAVGRVGRQQRLELAPTRNHRRRTRVDNDVLFDFAERMARTPGARRVLRWRPNSSLVSVAGQLRYAQARPVRQGRGRSYHLVAVEPTAYLQATLERARGGARLEELAAGLVADDPEIALDEALEYVGELADTQILVHELGVAVTGPEPMDALIAQLRSVGLDTEAAELTQVRDQLAQLDAEGAGVDTARYGPLIEGLGAILGGGQSLEPARLLQVDLASQCASATLGVEVVREVQRAMDALRRMTPRQEDPALAEFRRAFQERWEQREVPLGEVLDEESGIGFAAGQGPGTEDSPLLAGLPFGRAAGDSTVRWGRREAWLLARLQRAAREGTAEIVLEERDLRELELPEASQARPADAASAMIRVGQREGELWIVFLGASGPSGARLLGRFCHADAEVEQIVRDHLAAEAALAPHAILAEIVHLPDGRMGNVLCRPVLREHEIVYLGIGGAPPERQLSLDDLLVSVRGGRVVLRSRRLDREVLPRLTSAHNTSRGLGVYRFLSALQTQGTDALGWSWGPVRAPWLPRVRLGRVVLSRAEWTLSAEELRGLRKPGGLRELRQRRGLPRHVLLADGDNELWVDLDHELLVSAFLDEVAGRFSARLVEALPTPDEAVVEGPAGRHASEIVLTMTREPAEAPPPVAVRAARPVPRRFPPGSPWLFLKLYGGVTAADRVLREVVAPLVREALGSGYAQRWFFLRYADPAHHLRVRLEGDGRRLVAEVLPLVERLAAPLLADGSLHRIAVDTYEREVERYGGPEGISLCEDVFWRDSEAALAIVEGLEGDPGADARWRLALRGIDDLLRTLGFSASARAAVLERGRDGLMAEYGGGSSLRKAIGERYREHRDALDRLFGAPDPHDPLAFGLTALAERDAALLPVAERLRALDAAGALDPRLDTIALSLTHMACNRLLHASQRAQELVLYDLLRRHHARRRAIGPLTPPG